MSVSTNYEASTASENTTPVLRAVGVVKRFGDNVVLRGLDLDVASHEVVVLIGASGSGKSTLLRCANLLERVDDGQIFLQSDLFNSDQRPAVDVGIRHDNEFLVTCLADIKFSSKTCSHSCEKTANLLISKDFIHTCLFNVQNLTANWKDSLKLTVTTRFG